MLRFGRSVYLLLIPLLITVLISACATPLQPIEAPDSSAVSAADDDFTDGLMNALMARDYEGLQGMMGNSFSLTQWQATGVERPPAIAIMTLRDRYLGAGSDLLFPTDVDPLARLAEADLETLSTSPVALADAIYLSGLGSMQRDEAILLLARNSEDALYWRGIVIAPGGFEATATTTDAITLRAPAPQLIVDSTSTSASTVHAKATLSLTAALVPVPQSATAMMPSSPARIDVAAAASDTSVRGLLHAAQSRRYILHGQEGQLVTIALASNSGVANFSMTGIEDGQPYKQLLDESRHWQDTLPMTQDYLITVATTVALPFELTITTDGTTRSIATASSLASTP